MHNNHLARILGCLRKERAGDSMGDSLLFCFSHLKGGEVGRFCQGVLLLGGGVGPPLVRQKPLREDARRLLVIPEKKDMYVS